MSEQIKETQIMIGNYLFASDQQIHRVSKFDDKTIWFEKTINRHGVSCWLTSKISECIPIPLTEDILLKAGFEKCRKGYSLNVGGESFDYYIKDEFVLWYHKNRGYSLDTISKSSDRFYNNLHTLQNLFKALTQNDLKVEV